MTAGGLSESDRKSGDAEGPEKARSEDETRGDGGEEGQKRGTEEDISNSKRRAVFPWQLGSHRNSPAKDAIRRGKKTPTFSNPPTRARISGARSVFPRQRPKLGVGGEGVAYLSPHLGSS